MANEDPTIPLGAASGNSPDRGTDPEAETSAVAAARSAEPVATTPLPARDAPPRQIGVYRVLSELGRGGMGHVYLAQRQDDRFKKRVALKVMRRGVDTDEMLERFELERQMLGALNHPNIARVFDAGATEDGRPYFVMEYVEGRPIHTFCDEQGLSIDERITLFRKVCDAVQEAHRNLIVHRDIKPSNILVTATGEPKLLDFGIAKLLNPELLGLGVLTRPEQRLMTYEYASPEQVTGQPITTASDVYALGVLLYELLVGRRPYDIEQRVHREAVRVICEEQPERPSTAVGKGFTRRTPDGESRSVSSDEVARRRELPLTRLRRELSGDIDNIILMALRKSPNRRYPTAQALSEDLARHLRGEPVTAGPDSVRYRAAKFVGRHRSAVVTAGVIAAMLVTGLVTTAWQAQRAQRGWAEEARQRRLADDRYATLRGMIDLYGRASERIGVIEGATVARQVLADALGQTLEAMRPGFEQDPVLRHDLAEQYRRVGELRATLGGEVSGGVAALESALALLEGAAGEGVDATRAATLVSLAQARRDAGDMAGAEASAASAASAIERLPDGPARARLASEALRVRAWTAMRGGDVDGARALAARSADVLRPVVVEESPAGMAHVSLAAAIDLTGLIAAEAGETEGALEAYRDAARTARRAVDADSRNRPARAQLLLSLEKLALRLALADRLEEARRVFAEAQTLARETIEWDPVSARAQLDFARVHENEARVEFEARQYERAAEAAARFLTLARENAAKDPSDVRRRRQVGVAQEWLGHAHYATERWDDARDAYDGAVRTFEALVERDAVSREFKRDLMRVSVRLGNCGAMLDDTPLCRRAWDRGIDVGRALARASGLDGPSAGDLGSMLRNRGRVALEEGDGELAVALLVEAQEHRPRDDAKAVAERARAYRLAGMEQDAAAALEEAITRLESTDTEGAAMLRAMLTEIRGETSRDDG